MLQIRPGHIVAFQRAQDAEFRKLLVRHCRTHHPGDDPQTLASRTQSVARRHRIETFGGHTLLAEILSHLGLAAAEPDSTGSPWAHAILTQTPANPEEILEALRIQLALETGKDPAPLGEFES